MTGKLPSQRKHFDELVKPLDRGLLLSRSVNILGIIGGLFAVISLLTSLWPDTDQSDPPHRVTPQCPRPHLSPVLRAIT